MRHSVVASVGQLFGDEVPDGFCYEAGFLDAGEERLLLDHLAGIEFAPFQMRGVIARRRVAFFGRSYDGDGTAPPIPEFLEGLRTRAALWAGLAPEAFVMTLVNEYPAGAPIGWHRDAPQYDIVVGISLESACRMLFRPYVAPAALNSPPRRRRTATHEISLEPRSVYLLAGRSRTAYEHHIPPVAAHRYSVTFRTAR